MTRAAEAQTSQTMLKKNAAVPMANATSMMTTAVHEAVELPWPGSDDSMLIVLLEDVCAGVTSVSAEPDSGGGVLTAAEAIPTVDGRGVRGIIVCRGDTGAF